MKHLPVLPPITRREALCRIGGGFGAVGLASLLENREVEASTDQSPARASEMKAPHFPARAKHVIFLFLNGGLSQVDTFDPKPALDKYHGQPFPGGSLVTERKTGNLMRFPFGFKRY